MCNADAVKFQIALATCTSYGYNKLLCISAMSLRDSNECTNTERNSTDWPPNATDDRGSVEITFQPICEEDIIFIGENNQAVKPSIQSKILPMLGIFGLVKPVKQAIKMLWLTWIYITSPKIPRSQCEPQFVYLSTQWQKTRGRQKYFLQL